MNIFFKVTLETLKKNKNRTLVTIIGVILSTAMITAVTAMLFSVQKYMVEAAEESDGKYYFMASQLPKDKLLEILEDDEVLEGSYYKEIGYALLEDKTREESLSYKPYAYIAGFPKKAFSDFSIKLIAGRLPENSNEVLIPNHIFYNDFWDYKEGDKITLSIGRRMKEDEFLWQNNEIPEDGETLKAEALEEYTIVGVCEKPVFEDYSAPGYTLITLDDKEDGKLYQGGFILKNPGRTYEFINERLSEYSVVYNSQLLWSMGVFRNNNFYKVVSGLGIILISLIIFGSVFLIYNAFSISVGERTRQFGLLSSIGATRRQMRKSIGFEAFIISGLGIPLGIVSGLLGIGITLRFVGDGLSNYIYSAQEVKLRLSISWLPVLAAAAIAFLTVLISAWLPAKRAGMVSAIDAIRQSKDINIRPGEVKTRDFVLKLFGLEGMLAGKNYKRNRKKYRSTIFSLSLSVILFMGASSFVSYLGRSANTVFNVPGGDIYYEFWNMEEEEGLILYEKLKAADHVTFSTRYSSLYMSAIMKPDSFNPDYTKYFDRQTFSDGHVGLPVSMVVLSDEDFLEYAKSLKLSGEEYINTNVLKGIGYAYDRSFDEESYKYKEIFLFQDRKDKEFELTETQYRDNGSGYGIEENKESGLYGRDVSILIDFFADSVPDGWSKTSNNGNLRVFIPNTQYEKLFASYDLGKSTTAVFNTDECNITFESMQKILRANHIYDSSNLYNARADFERDQSMLIAIRILSAGFITLISLIAAANVFNTISTNIKLRKREFAMLESIGMTRKEFMKMMRYECLVLSLYSLTVGLPGGILVTAAIYRVILGGVSMEFYFPFLSVLEAVSGVLGIVFITMWHSTRRKKKNSIVEVLKEENI